MPTPSELLHANLHEIFGERNHDRRRAAIEKYYTEDITFSDPEGAHTGWDAVDNAAEALLTGAPAEFSFEDAGPQYLGGETAALAWTFGPPGSPVARGIDILTIRDGQVARIQTILAGPTG
ncbi:hypothetical protein BH11ACT3_BH11ACT3_26460 [soil metagenome]